MEKLKGTLKRYRNDRLSVKVKFIIKDLKLAWQRAWRGFDDTAWFNYDVWFREVTLETLTIYKENCISMWYLGDDEIAQKYVTKELGLQLLSEDAQDAILETMIFHLRWSDDEYVIEQLFGDKKLTREDYVKSRAIAKQNWHAFIRLFEHFKDNLWD